MTDRAICRAIVFSVTINAVAHLKGAYLLYFCHLSYITVTRRTLESRSNVGVMDELDMVGNPMDSKPSDWLILFGGGSKFLYFGLSARRSTNYLRMAKHAFLYRWNHSSWAFLYVAMAERAR